MGALGPHFVDSNNVEGFQYAVVFTYFFFTETALWLHYVGVGVLCFVSAAEFDGFAAPILRVLQLVFISVILFAMAHYYMALLSDAPAYHGITPLTDHQIKWLDTIQRLLVIPTQETVVNCIYFSTVTMATVGYGDVYPISIYAKLTTIIQIAFSFGLIVVILGWAIGHAREIAVKQPDKQK